MFKTKPKPSHHTFLRFSGLIVFAFFLFTNRAFSAGEAVTFNGATSSAGTTYQTNISSGKNVLTFNVQAQNPPGTFDGTYAGTVTVGLYDTVTGQTSEPNGVWVPLAPNSGAPVTGGTSVMTFVGGRLNFAVTLTAGSNSMQVSIFGSTITSGNSYPGSIGGPLIPGYVVQGFSTSYYLETASLSTVAT